MRSNPQLGGATGLIGDPSGRNTERDSLAQANLQRNLDAIRSQIARVFDNHKRYLWNESKGKASDLKDVK